MRKILAVDTETFDPKLKDYGTGVYRKDSRLLGVSFADETGWNEYLDLGHPGVTEATARRNTARVRELLAEPCPKLFANAMYDLDHLVNGYGMELGGTWHDVIHAESLLDEYRPSYSLDSLAESYLKRHKEKTRIEQWCEDHKLKGDPRQWLWQMPHSVVAPYAKADTALLLPIHEKQSERLAAENLVPLYDMERSLFPMLLAMRRNGVRVSEKRRREVERIHSADLSVRKEEWEREYGDVNCNSTKQLAELFDFLGMPYDMSNTGKKELLKMLDRKVDEKRLAMVDPDALLEELGLGKERKEWFSQYPSITHDTLEDLAEEHPVARKVERIKKLDKLLGTFINGMLVDHVTAGRIHPTFMLFGSDEGGTVSGRLACRAPNAQQVSAKKGDFDPLVRSCFVPEEGCLWGKIDYSQIEYRIIAHYAIGPKADDIRDQYINDPSTDYHKVVQDWTGIDRSSAKRLNFGCAYMMGAKSMSRKFHWPIEKAVELTERYYEMVPFLVPTRNEVINVAKRRGHIRTLLGRRCRISPQMKKDRKEYVAFNRLIQGTAADLMKKAMADTWKAGVYGTLVPHLTVHDELDVSVPDTEEGREAFKEMRRIMETAIKLKVPILAEAELGPNWGMTA